MKHKQRWLVDGVLVISNPDGSAGTEIELKCGRPDGTIRVSQSDGTRRLVANYKDGELQSINRWDSEGDKIPADWADEDTDPFEMVIAGAPWRTPTTRGRAPAAAQPRSGVVAPPPTADDPVDAVDAATRYRHETLPQVGDIEVRTSNGRAYIAGSGAPFTGRLLTAFDDGTSNLRGYQNGLPHGEWANYSPTGQLRSEEMYANGEKTGAYTIYHDNGQPQFRTELENSRTVGVTTTWSRDGLVTGSWDAPTATP